MKKRIYLLLVSCFAGCASPVLEDWRAKTHDPEYVHTAVKEVTNVIVHDIFSPPVASRIYAYVSVAGYETAIQEDDRFNSLAGQLTGLEHIPKPDKTLEYCFPLATVVAMLQTGRNLVFSEDKIDNFYGQILTQFKASGMPEEVFNRSVLYGKLVADHVIAWSSKDNYKQSRSFPKYTIVEDPATWKPTPPAYMDAVEPYWNKIRTMALDSAQQFKPKRPTPFSVTATSQFYKEAEEVYSIGKTLTDSQREIASFWDCNPFVMNVKGHVMFATKKISPGGHWMNITSVACHIKNATFVETTEAYARVAISLFDGFISSWDEKYRSRLIRPETYINQYIDEGWTPLLQTPPFPEYTSAHSVISAASSVTLTALFGEGFAFRDSTELEFGLHARDFSSFTEAAREAAISRMYGGIHYRPAFENGFSEGIAVGEFIHQNIQTRKSPTVQLDGLRRL